MQNDIAAAADIVSKGPHIDAPRIDPAVRKAEIDYVVTAANAALPKTVLKKLGALSLAAASEDDAPSYFAQIRSEPIGNSGCEFRFPLPARNTGRRDLDATVAELVDAALRFAKTGSKLRSYATLIREMAEEAIAPATGGIARMRVSAVGVTPHYSEGEIDTTIDIEMLGEDLTSGIERVTERDTDKLDGKLAKLVAKHLERRKALAQAKAVGATGWIDDAALRIINAAGFDLAEIVGMLRTQRDVEFSYGGEDGYDVSGALGWRDGVIDGFAERRYTGGLFRLDGRVLTIETKGLLATVIADLVGRRLRDVIDLALIPENALIVDFSESGEWLYLELEISRSPIEAALGGA
jgi:hypothetical protein